MDRRGAVVVGGVAALSVAIPSLAQRFKVWRIGCLSGLSRPQSIENSPLGGLVAGLRELGYAEGRNLLIDWRFAEGKYERFDELARELVQLGVDFIVAFNSPAALAAKRATQRIPIIMTAVTDPVASGLVPNLARPGGNVTGMSQITGEVAPKAIELMRTIKPTLSRVAVLSNPDNPATGFVLQKVPDAARRLGVHVLFIEAHVAEEIERAFVGMVREHAEAVIVLSDPMFLAQRQKIADAAMNHRLPCASQQSEYVEAGALVSYGQSLREQFRGVATYVDRIIKGAQPGDLPIEQPTKFELVINMKTARTLGIKIPSSLLVRADRVIE